MSTATVPSLKSAYSDGGNKVLDVVGLKFFCGSDTLARLMEGKCTLALFYSLSVSLSLYPSIYLSLSLSLSHPLSLSHSVSNFPSLTYKCALILFFSYTQTHTHPSASIRTPIRTCAHLHQLSRVSEMLLPRSRFLPNTNLSLLTWSSSSSLSSSSSSLSSSSSSLSLMSSLSSPPSPAFLPFRPEPKSLLVFFPA